MININNIYKGEFYKVYDNIYGNYKLQIREKINLKGAYYDLFLDE